MTTDALPTFKQPPVTEVALAVQFEPLARLRAVDLGTVRDAFADAYPVVEEQPRKPPMTVDSAGPTFQLNIIDSVVQPNLWFLSSDGDRLVQFQQDRLVVNWRRQSGEEYPRYAETVRPMFVDAWDRLGRALDELGLEHPSPNVCEVAYINAIESGDGWTHHGQLSNVLAPWSGEHSDEFLADLVDVRLAARYAMPDESGWLTIESQPVHRADDGLPAFLLQLTARGRPLSDDLEGALNFLDLGRECIVRGFASITTKEMQKIWGREHV